MTDQELLYLLARAYIAMRLEYITSRIKPVYTDVRDALDKAGRLPRSVENSTDSDIREAFMPRAAAPEEPVDIAEEVSAVRKPTKKAKGD